MCFWHELLSPTNLSSEDLERMLAEGHYNTVHSISHTKSAETPGGSETTEYYARCGEWDPGYTMVYLPFRFHSGTLEEAKSKGMRLCPKCFGEQGDNP